MGNQTIKDLGLDENGQLPVHHCESKGSLDSDHGFEVIKKENFDCTDASEIADTEDSCVKAKRGRFFKRKHGRGPMTNETVGLGEEQETLEKLLEKIPRNKKDMERMTRQQCIEIHGKNELIKVGRAILDQLTAERQRNLERIEEREQVIHDKEVSIEFFHVKVERLSQQIDQKERELQDKERRLEEVEEKQALSHKQTRELEATIKEMQQTFQGRDQRQDVAERKLNSSALLERRLEMDSLRLESERYQLQLREKDNTIEQKENVGRKLSQENDRMQKQLRESERRCLEKQVEIDRLHREKERGIAYVKKLELNCLENRTAMEKSKEEIRAYREQLEQKERLVSVKQRSLERTERRNAELFNQVQTLGGQLQNERESRRKTVSTLQDEKYRCEERLRQVQRELDNERRSARNLEFDFTRAKNSLEILRQDQPWIISKNEITVSKKVLGTGAWGRVMEGKFRGTKVAVKEIHEVIQSAHNRLLFDREITFTTLVRHPCILQFLGVADYRTNSPLLVTELMDMTLSELMKREGALDNRNMLILGLDIAYGLNYLHCFRPAPILHRDVNCGNVMVWKNGDTWRGKLCDFGSAEFVSEDMSINPGNPFYSPPEASTPQQSPKMDVYSYGVLICEMGTGETPSPSDRDRQVNLIWHKKAREVIINCTRENPSERPTMSQVIYELETIDS